MTTKENQKQNFENYYTQGKVGSFQLCRQRTQMALGNHG